MTSEMLWVSCVRNTLIACGNWFKMDNKEAKKPTIANDDIFKLFKLDKEKNVLIKKYMNE